ncbi:MAG: DUF3817 domain-containing protein [Candidatus Marinarcus sp.]|uniref:DUF3817 domain-containing protein n=1 Tax=Candidatus Marinarcus sp. TaxID=3100987 RepID=UPI003B0023B1
MLNTLNQFRLISFLEGLSYITLLFIAMPLKYFAHDPIAVKIVGMGHGILFTLFIIFLAQSMKKHQWKTLFSMKLFIASLLPFGTFFMDKKLKAYRVVA